MQTLWDRKEVLIDWLPTDGPSVSKFGVSGQEQDSDAAPCVREPPAQHRQVVVGEAAPRQLQHLPRQGRPKITPSALKNSICHLREENQCTGVLRQRSFRSYDDLLYAQYVRR